MCGLECDVCKQKLTSGDNTTPTICIFPCFHKYCERCKAQVLATARPQHGAESRVSCKLCNQHFLLNVLYDYSENQIEKIFCLHCNIKNKAPVEWRCKSCENRYLCAHCSQPHYHSGHELEPVMKPSIPLRSQCSSHSNVLATYLCSCQARLCDYCLNNHADGSTEHPHEQRIAYTKLAERARTELETIRRQSIRDTEKIENLKEKVATNKKQIGIQATQARTAVANEVVELVNAIIRRGNDIVTCIDSTEETKLKNCGQLEKEMQHWLDRLTKIESFTQSALFTTVQQDHPGMWSASMFSQSALFQVNKRRDLAKNTLEQFERSPIISYQSWSTKELYSAIRSFGLLNLDGEVKIPAQTTPQNAHMFSISNSFTQSNSNSNTSNNSIDTPTIQQQHKRPIPPTQNVPPIIRSTSNHSNASTSQQQQHNVNFSGSNNNNIQQQPLQQQPQRIVTPSASIMILSSPPPNIQPIPTSIHHPIQQQQQQYNIGGPLHSEIHHISVSSPTPIIPQLLQQPLNVSGSRFVQQHPQQHPQQQQPQHHHPQRPPQLLPLNCPLPVVGSPPISLPNTPLTPVMHGPPDQMQIIRQQNMVLQQQHMGQQLQQQPHQQQQRSIQQQQPCLPLRQPPPPQFRMQQILQNHAGSMPHQIQQQNICQNSQQPIYNQQQPPPPPHIIQQQQQMQQHQQYMTAQRLHLQQQQLMLSQQYHPQVMSPPFQQQPQPQQHIVHVLDSPHNQQQMGNGSVGQEDRPLPPIISRIPNPRLNAAQQFVDSVIGQNLSSIPSATDNHPQHQYQNSGVTPLEHLVEMTSASTMPQQISSRNFENLPAHISHKQSTSSAIPEIVDLLDDEEEAEGGGEQNKNNSSCQELEASINRLITVPIANDIIINSEKIEKINENLNLLQQQDSAIQQLQQQQNNNSSPHLLKALRQNKPQSAAADSTVSFAGNNSTESPSNVAPINTNSGTKRKPASINLDDGEQQKQKRLAKEIDNNKILNLNNNEEKRPVNISPPADLITTTTEENGEGGGEDFDNNKEENNNEQKLGKLKTSRKSETPNSLDLRVFSSPEEQNAEEVSTQQEKKNEKISINSKTGKILTNKPLPSNNNNEEASCSNNKKSEEKICENVGNNNKTEESRNATSDDFWDDYCYVCSQGCDETTGSLGCCESCPRVFHSHCHVPRIRGFMEDLPDDWRCSVCVECEPLTVQTQEFGNREQLLCAKVFLACFEDNSQVELFVNQVPQTETDYHSVIKQPIWLQLIGERINFKSYTNVSKFLDDMNLLFQNFSTFNSPSDPLATKGKSVYTRYIQAVKKFMPFYQKQIWIYVSLYSTRFNSTQATTSSSLNLPMEEDNVEHNNRNRLVVKGTTVGRKRGGSKAKSQTPA